MKVSIIVPVYNIKTELLEKCITSLINQTLNDIEIILVDDASTDPKIGNSVAWWQRETDLPVVYMKNEENLGFGGSMNVGIWAASACGRKSHSKKSMS